MWPDPFGELRKLLEAGYTAILTLLEQYLIHPTRISDGGILPDFYSGGANLAVYIAYMITVFSVAVFAVIFRRGMRIWHAFIAGVLLSTAPLLWVEVVNYMMKLGDALAQAADFYNPPQGGGLTPFSMATGNLLWDIAGLSAACFWLGILVSVVVAYEFIIIALKFFGPIALVLMTFGPRSRKFANALFAVGFVATTLGRAWAILFLNLGQLAIYTFPAGTSSFGMAVGTVMSYALALASQIALIAVTYKGVTAVEGALAAKVTGTTEAVIRKVVRVDMVSHKPPALAPLPVYIAGGSEPGRFDQVRSQASNSARQAALSVGKKAGRALTTATAGAAAGAFTAAGLPVAGGIAATGINKLGGKFFQEEA